MLELPRIYFIKKKKIRYKRSSFKGVYVRFSFLSTFLKGPCLNTLIFCLQPYIYSLIIIRQLYGFFVKLFSDSLLTVNTQINRKFVHLNQLWQDLSCIQDFLIHLKEMMQEVLFFFRHRRYKWSRKKLDQIKNEMHTLRYCIALGRKNIQ